MTIYRWTEISNVPRKPGIYAWYYSPEITNYDLTEIISNLSSLNSKEIDKASELVKEFLYNNIFSVFQEESYKAVVQGSLKPAYKGDLEHKPHLSESLISRIIDEPERLRTIKDVLESSAPNFSSPIYIGMSNKLGIRLRQHKKLIEKYYEETPQIEIKDVNFQKKDLSDLQKDQSFAAAVFKRNMIPNRLFVVINILDDCGKRYIDIENILNRIHYPLLGKN